MSDSIVCEHFEITDAIRDHVNKNIAEIKDFLPKEENVSVFLNKSNKNAFQALFKVHVWKKEFIAKETGENLYNIIMKSKDHLIRQLDDHKKKFLDQRRT